MASIQNLKRAFNEGLDAEKLIEKEPDVNTIAALLKLYFRELREPLMLFDFYPSFIAAADITDYNEKLYTIKSLVHSLPETNFNTLQYLMLHLSRVQDQYQTTKMDSANLAICFAPNLLRQEVDDLTSIINTGKQSSIIDTLIEQQEWVFDPYPEEDDETGDQQQQVHHAVTKLPADMVDEEYEDIGGESDGVRSHEQELEKGDTNDQEAHFQQQLLQEQQDEIYRHRAQEYRQDEQFFEVDETNLQGHYDQQKHHHLSSEANVEPVPATATTTTTTTTAMITTTALTTSPPAYNNLREEKTPADPKTHF
ncbi:Rho GTPase activation protein [Linnemannia elongata]|nr:Rho GTPase activation protein [Linnemannia elongata]